MHNYVGKWLIGLPCHHPAWPRYCNECRDLASGCIATKTLRLRVPESYRHVIVEPDLVPFVADPTVAMPVTMERKIIPEVPSLIISFSVTACLDCRTFFVSGEDLRNKDAGGLFSAIREYWGMQVVTVKQYLGCPGNVQDASRYD